MKFSFFVFGLLVCGCAVALADDGIATADKSGYCLFNPTPSDALRPVRMEAYDNVTDATTVDAGHFQVEGSLINFYTFQQEFTQSNARYDFSQTLYSWTPRFTAGLLNNLDLEVSPSYRIRSSHSEGTFSDGTPLNQTVNTSGFGNVQVEPKLNLWGNDGGCTAFSVAPIVSIPTSSGHMLGALDFAFAARLPEGCYLKLESEVFQQRINGRHYAGFFEGLSINKSMCARLDVYAALTAQVSSYSGDGWFGYVGFGAIYKVTRDFQLFGGLNFGLTENAFDYNPKFGIVWRR